MVFIFKKLTIILPLLIPLPLLAQIKPPASIDCVKEAAKAEKLYLNGKNQSALHSFDLCLDKDKKSLLFFIEILPENSSPAYYENLLKIADKAIKEKNEGYIHYLALCKYYRNKNRLNNALANCKKALMLKPVAYPVYRELGLTYAKIKNSKKAIENFKHGIEISSCNYKARYLLAEEYSKSKNNKLALHNYLKALSLLPYEAENTIFSSDISKRIDTLQSILLKEKEIKQEKAKSALKIKAEDCIDKANAYLNSDRLEEAYVQISNCLKMDYSNSKARIFLAGILTRLGKYETAILEYKKIGKIKQTQAELKAFCQLKIGEIYSKMKNNKLAILHYQKALEINKTDINALLKIAECHENELNHKKAMHYYKSILKVEPANMFASLKLKELKAKTMSDEDILKEMKLRLIIDEKTETLTKDIRDLFRLMRKAETKYAVDYLKEKNVMLAGKIITTKNQEGKVKLFLNAKGFESYRWLMTREAIGFFEKKEMDFGAIFLLRDKKGAMIFDKKGNLTNSGLNAYWSAMQGEKSWLMPYERPTADTLQEKENEEIEKIRNMGYREISDAELGWLLKATDCPIEVLMPPENNYLRIIKTKESDRNFLCYITPSICSSSGHGAILSVYMEKYRAGDSYIPTGKTSTAFFGTGAVERRNFCHDGKIWR
ncbi:MAG: tetratricopeptide repeat protein [Elusimicrobia bacterium]|nr:tetratricopeptide repeat protein [Elusimicrobiota bacterium]